MEHCPNSHPCKTMGRTKTSKIMLFKTASFTLYFRRFLFKVQSLWTKDKWCILRGVLKQGFWHQKTLYSGHLIFLIPALQVPVAKDITLEDVKQQIFEDSDLWHDARMPEVYAYLRGSNLLGIDPNLKAFLDSFMQRDS